MTPRRPLPRAASLGYQINHLARLMERGLRDRIAAHGVVPGQFAQLLALYETDGLTQAELCERVRIEQPTMAATLARMERDGLITRSPDPHDRRRSLVRLTPRARELEADLVSAALGVNAVATDGLTARDVAVLMTAVATAIDNLETTRTGPRPDGDTPGAQR